MAEHPVLSVMVTVKLPAHKFVFGFAVDPSFQLYEYGDTPPEGARLISPSQVPKQLTLSMVSFGIIFPPPFIVKLSTAVHPLLSVIVTS